MSGRVKRDQRRRFYALTGRWPSPGQARRLKKNHARRRHGMSPIPYAGATKAQAAQQEVWG